MVTADVLHRRWSLPSSQLVYGAELIRFVAEYQEPLAEADVFSLLLSAVSAWKQTSSGWHLLFTTILKKNRFLFGQVKYTTIYAFGENNESGIRSRQVLVWKGLINIILMGINSGPNNYYGINRIPV